MPPSDASQSSYVLSTGQAGAWRLELLHRVFGPGTQAALAAAGLAPGMVVADIGCGTGAVSTLLARRVSPGGSVAGVDASAEQLDIARRAAQADGLGNLNFVVANALDTGLPRGAFDFVYCRFLLCHLEQPLDALREMRALLRPGGTLLCEDQEGSTLSSVPPSEAYARAAARSIEFGRRRGVDLDMGRSLPRMLRETGLRDVRVTIHQPAFFEGEEKRFYEHTAREAMEALVARGFTTREEAEARVAAMAAVNDDPAVLVVMPRIWQVWGRSPGA